MDEHQEDQEDQYLINVFLNGVNYFKSLLCFWKQISVGFTFEFYPDRIESKTTNQTNTLCLHLVIPGRKLIHYENNVLDYVKDVEKFTTEEKNRQKITATVTTENFETSIQFPKNSHAYLSILNNNHQEINLSSSENKQQGSVIPMRELKGDFDYELTKYEKTDLVVRILTDEFFGVIRRATRGKSKFFEFVPQKNGLLVRGRGAAENIIVYKCFGVLDDGVEPKNPKLYTNSILLPVNRHKGLIRLLSVSPTTSMINVYHRDKKPVMFEAPVGQYGKYRLYCRNPQIE